MKIRKLLSESESHPYAVKHSFDMHQGDNKISTTVHIKVHASHPDQAKKAGDAQMKKIMSYMRANDSNNDENEEMVAPQNTQSVDAPPMEATEQEEQGNPQQDARSYWQSKGYDVTKKTLSTLTSDDIDKLVSGAYSSASK